MSMTTSHTQTEPSRAEVDALPGISLLEFGASWCGICAAAQPEIAAALSRHPQVRHLKIEDGPGRTLGRSFRVKLWPTLVLLRDGKEVERLVRPGGKQIDKAVARLVGRN